MKRQFCILWLILSSVASLIACTIGVAVGAATSDGRPMLWKSLFEIEDSIYDASTLLLENWRNKIPSYAEMLMYENHFAEYAYSKMLILESLY